MLNRSLKIKILFFKTLLVATLTVTGLLFIFDYIYKPEDYISHITDSGLFLSALMAFLLYQKTKKLELSTLLFLIPVLGVVQFQAISDAGLYNPYFILLVMSIGFSGSILLNNKMLGILHFVIISGIVFLIHYQMTVLNGFSPLKYDAPITTGVVFIIVYSVISTLAFLIKQQYDRSKEQLYALSLDLKVKNDEIEAQNEELRQNQEALKNINMHLEELVEKRTEKIKNQNEQLIKFAFDNAHKIRGPLARILGLFNIIKIDNQEANEKLYGFIEKEAISMDNVTKKINENLSEEIESEMGV